MPQYQYDTGGTFSTPDAPWAAGGVGEVFAVDATDGVLLFKRPLDPGRPFDWANLRRLTVARQVPGAAVPQALALDPATLEPAGYVMLRGPGKPLRDHLAHPSFQIGLGVRRLYAVAAALLRPLAELDDLFVGSGAWQDPKPENWTLVIGDPLALLDPGVPFAPVATAIDLDSYATPRPDGTLPQLARGTGGYQSPSLLKDPAAPYGRADYLCGLGAVLFELFFECLPTDPHPARRNCWDTARAAGRGWFFRYVAVPGFPPPDYRLCPDPAVDDLLCRALTGRDLDGNRANPPAAVRGFLDVFERLLQSPPAAAPASVAAPVRVRPPVHWPDLRDKLRAFLAPYRLRIQATALLSALAAAMYAGAWALALSAPRVPAAPPPPAAPPEDPRPLPEPEWRPWGDGRGPL